MPAHTTRLFEHLLGDRALDAFANWMPWSTQVSFLYCTIVLGRSFCNHMAGAAEGWADIDRIVSRPLISLRTIRVEVRALPARQAALLCHGGVLLLEAVA
jgi:hypothetical protein